MNAKDLAASVQRGLRQWVETGIEPQWTMITVMLEADEAHAITLALFELQTERPGWAPYLKKISDKITPGQWAAFEEIRKNAVLQALTKERQ